MVKDQASSQSFGWPYSKLPEQKLRGRMVTEHLPTFHDGDSEHKCHDPGDELGTTATATNMTIILSVQMYRAQSLPLFFRLKLVTET